MKLFLKSNFIFISIYLIVLIVVGYSLLHNGKIQIHECINANVGNDFLNIFFKYFTHVGDGVTAILIIIITLFFSVKKSGYLCLTYIFASITSTILKNYFYTDTCRPAFAFEYFVRKPLNLVDGVEMNMFNSFPSGHSTAVFAIFMGLLFMSKNIYIKAACFIIAFLAAYSRIYLSQHWLVDIYFGSIIGFSYAVFFYFIYYSKKHQPKYDHGILTFINSKA